MDYYRDYGHRHARSFRNRGIALMMVVVVLAMLVFIAVPFSNSMRIEKRETGGVMLATKAKLAATGAYEYAVSRLSRSCDNFERYLPQPALFKTPDYDSIEEYRVDIAIPELATSDPHGEIWSVHVEDEQGKVNLNSATPWLLGNLIGSAIVARNAGAYDTEIWVDSTDHFPRQKGFLWIDGELVSYRQALKDCFSGCKRGLYRESPCFNSPQQLEPGTLVLDPRAYRICRHRIISKPGQFTPYRTVDELRRIADLGVYPIIPELFAKIRSMLTVYSGRSSGHGWIHPQKIGNSLIGMQSDGPDVVQVSDASLYRPGMTVRITQDDRQAYALILKVQGNTIVLDSKFQQLFTRDRAIISVMEPHPININSAPPKVLYAMFKGLRVGNDWIDAKQAGILTSALYGWRKQGQTIKSLANLRDFLQGLAKDLEKSGVKDERGGKGLSSAEIDAILSSARSISGDYRRYRGLRSASGDSDAYRLPWPPLASVVFRNEDTYTIETNAILNNPSGAPLAQHTLERIATVAPLETLRWRLESQRDFRHYLARLPAFRVITWPYFCKNFTTFAASDPQNSGGGLSLDTVRVGHYRPSGTNAQYFAGDDSHDGYLCPKQSPGPIRFDQTGIEMVPGALAFWFRPEQKQRRYVIFDMGVAAWEDRITILYENGTLFLRVTDSALEQATAEIAAKLTGDRHWYHIIAGWYSTGPGGLFLWIDGRPAGTFYYRYRFGQQKSLLTKAINGIANRIPLDRTVGLPPQGVVQIGHEVIEYQQILGNTLVVREAYQGFEQEKLGRGARGTSAQNHFPYTPVVPLGYSASLQSKVFPATVLTEAVAEEGIYTRLAATLTDKTREIKVKSTRDFQQSGFLLIADAKKNTTEIVRYGEIKANIFSDCRRGQLDKKAESFSIDAYVFPLSLNVKDGKDYEDKGIVQLGNEWVTYEHKIDHRYLVFNLLESTISDCKKTGKFRPLYRGTGGTMSSRHMAKTMVIPVFRIASSRAGRFDTVTIIHSNDSKQKEQHTINWAYGSLVAFQQDIIRRYEPGRGTRVIKFPSGELPTTVKPCHWGQDIVSDTPSGTFWIDELRIFQTRFRLNMLLQKAVQPGDTEIELNTSLGISYDGGLLKVGDEYIGYTDVTKKEAQALRGFAGTGRGAYAAGTPAYPVFFLPVTSLSKSVKAYSSKIPLKLHGDFPAEGYVRVDDEIIGYSIKTSTNLDMPTNREGHGLLRGAFGSTPVAHQAGTLVYYFPTRYWDRFVPGYDGPESAYFEAAKFVPGAYWRNIVWKESNPAKRYLAVVVKARIDGEPSWEEVPTNKPGGIFQFSDADKPNLLNVQGNTLEIRVYFSYRQNAFRTAFWKEKALLQSLFVEYRQQTRVWESHD